MARRKLRRSTLFTVIALIGLLSLGIGYAAWEQSLTINGSVGTADFNVVWANASAAPLADPLSSTADCDVFNVTDHSFDVSVTDAYPGFVCRIDADILNNGEVEAGPTVPLIIDEQGFGAQLVIDASGCVLGDIAPSASQDCTIDVGIDPVDSDENQIYTFIVTASYGLGTP